MWDQKKSNSQAGEHCHRYQVLLDGDDRRNIEHFKRVEKVNGESTALRQLLRLGFAAWKAEQGTR